MLTANEWIGFIVVTFCAGGLVSGLLWITGRSHGIPVKELRRCIGLLWLAIVACVAGLVAVRLYLGGGIMDFDAHGDTPVEVRRLQTQDWLLVAAGAAWTVLWLFVAARAAGRINARAAEAARRSSDDDL